MNADLRNSIPLATRTGREIVNFQDPDLLPEKSRRLIEQCRKKFPFVILRRPPAGQYNCHGLTLANRRTGIYPPADVLAILDDDGYRKIPRSEAQVGDLALYVEGRSVEHTGLVVKVEDSPALLGGRAIQLLSKWGQAGEYNHAEQESPYSSLEIEYWTDRP